MGSPTVESLLEENKKLLQTVRIAKNALKALRQEVRELKEYIREDLARKNNYTK